MARGLSRISRNKNTLAILTFLAVVLLFPALVRSGYYVSVAIVIGLYTLVTVGLCLLMGYAGQISFGHGAFYGLGAYTTGLLAVKAGVPPWLGIFAGAAVAGLVALVIGKPTLNLKHHFLALGTLGFSIIVYIFLVELVDFTGGPSGLVGIPRLTLGPIVFSSDLRYYYLVWFFAFLSLVLSNNLVNSRIGRALRAIKGSEVAAGSMGVDAARHKLEVFVLSAVYAGLAGALYAHWVRFLSPSPFGILTSILFVVMTVVGGMESVWGSVFGAALVTILGQALRSVVTAVMARAGGQYEVILFGLILITVLIFMPEGLAVGIYRSYQRISGGRLPLQGKVAEAESRTQPSSEGAGDTYSSQRAGVHGGIE